MFPLRSLILQLVCLSLLVISISGGVFPGSNRLNDGIDSTISSGAVEELGYSVPGINNAKGKTGSRGPRGSPGVSGLPGLNGPAGPPGQKGEPGTNGLPGLNGYAGKDGEDGHNGIPGSDGLPGLVGVPGSKGERGEPGQKGEPGTNKGERGPPGYVGLPGFVGGDGAKGDTGSPGQPGLNGLPGSKGPAGPKGQKGESGLPGLNGAPGKDGAKGDTGSPGPRGILGLNGLPGSEGPAGPKGDNGPKGEAGAPGEKAAHRSTGILLVKHSQNQTVPTCDGHTKLWDGYSLLLTVGNKMPHFQDLGGAGSCASKFSTMPFIFCDASNVCRYATQNDHSYWLTTSEPTPMPVSETHIKEKISRCVVCEVPANVMAVHSKSSNVPDCPNDWSKLWEGYSFLTYTAADKQGGGQSSSSSGSCLQDFRANPSIECDGAEGYCDVDKNELSFWMATIQDNQQFRKPQSEIIESENIRSRISRCSVCIKNV